MPSMAGAKTASTSNQQCEKRLSRLMAQHPGTTLVRGRAEVKVVTESWLLITGLSNILFQAVQLPTPSELEAKALGVAGEPAK